MSESVFDNIYINLSVLLMKKDIANEIPISKANSIFYGDCIVRVLFTVIVKNYGP